VKNLEELMFLQREYLNQQAILHEIRYQKSRKLSENLMTLKKSSFSALEKLKQQCEMTTQKL